jgi:CRP-like cAMP-binding protein
VRARSLKIYTHLAKIPLIGFLFKQMITDHLLFIVDVIIGLVDIVEELRDRLENFPMSQIVMAELESNVNDAKTYLNGVESQFVDLISFVSTKRFTKIIFGEQINIIEEKYDRGELEDKEYETLTEMIHKRIHNFEKITKMKFNPPTFTSLITSFPMFTLLTDAEKRHLIQNSETRNFKQGFKLCEKGSECNDIYLILKGEAESLIGTFTTRKGVGSIISFANLINDDNISLITSQTTEKVRAQVIRRSALKKIMTQNTEFRDMVIKEGGVVLRHLIEAETTSVGSKLKELIRESEVRYFVEGDKVSLKEGGFLLKGTLKAGDIVYSDYKILPHTIGIFKAETDGLLLSFNNVQDNRRQSSLIFSFDARA